MSKKHLLSIKSMPLASFAYTPPNAAYDAVRILVKVDLQRVSRTLMLKVLRGLRRADPGGKILVIVSAEGEQSAKDVFDASDLESLLDGNSQGINAESLDPQFYPNRLAQPDLYRTIIAPALLAEAECRITVSALSPGDLPALRTIRGLIPSVPHHETGLKDLYFTLGWRFDGAVIEAGDTVVWGDDLLAVEEAALRQSGAEVPALLGEMLALRKSLPDSESPTQEEDHEG